MTTRIIVGNCLTELDKIPPESVNCIVTSPPYFGLRNYLDNPEQLGQEPTIAEYVANMVAVFDKLWRVLRKDGTAWLNLGDSYAGSGKGRNADGSIGIINSPLQKSNQGSLMNEWRGGRTTTALSNDSMNRNGLPKQNDVKPKSLCMIPARVAIALQDYGWYLRSEIIWHKTSAMPESVKDRPTKAHEMIYLLTKSPRYWYDADAVREPLAQSSLKRYALANSRVLSSNGNGFAGDNPIAHENLSHDYKSGQGSVKSRGNGVDHLVVGGNTGANLRDVWSIAGANYSGSHFATFPTEIPRRCILAGCPPNGVVLDPFGGAGTTALVAEQLGRDSILIELNQQYAEMARKRLIADCPMFNQVTVEPTNS